MEVLNLKARLKVKPFKKGTKVDFLSYDYIIEAITDTDVRMRRVGSKDKESVVTLKIGSKRFNKIFLGNYEGAYNKILEAEEILDVDIENKASDELSIVIFKDIVDSLRTGSGFFKSKTEATLWCFESLSDNSELKEYYKNPLYTLLFLYYHKTELTEVTESVVEKYINTSGFRDKFTDFFKFNEEVLKGSSDVGELMTYIPDDYEDIVLEFLLGRVQLNVTLKDLKYILQQYERKNSMAKDNGLKVFSDEEISKLSGLFSGEAAARGLVGEDSDSDSDVDLAELLEDMDAKEVLALAKEAGATIKATKKTLELSPEGLAELLEETLDDEQMEAFMELLEGADDEDSDEEEDDDSEDEEGDDDSEDEDGELAELLESALEEDSISEILDGAGLDVKLNAKQKKMSAEELAEFLESKLDEDEMESLLEYLQGDDEEEDSEDEEDDEEEDSDLAGLLETVMESESIEDILEEAGVEIKLNAKQKKFDAEEMAELLEEKLDEDEMEALTEYLSEYEAEEKEDDEDSDDEAEDEEEINIDDLDEEEILELAEEEGIEFKKVKGKVNPKDMKRIKAELKAMYE